MNRTTSALAILFFTFLPAFASEPGQLPAQQASRLNSIKRIYLGDFGSGEGADLVREKVRVLLMQSGRFTAAEDPGAADAILTGSAGVERSQHGRVSGSPYGGVSGTSDTVYRGYGVLRLVDTKTKEAIWFFEYKRGFAVGSRSSRVAKQIVERLLKAATDAAPTSTSGEHQ